ncbi:HAMP domain-containing sensor histidine kinase [Azospirillum sp.]|uniref:HAMP domain-containing sensor histidine kinase n=1 Tax=Azospirillum sp. TaxID=34012 RepID=UPI002D74FE1A|nr:HAMP domain-containing sensor histidine kinase [Azospirillum sp.]HYD66220.1 HAMP domain-containing sensor histidine kinase [Azospirillum sp.]
MDGAVFICDRDGRVTALETLGAGIAGLRAGTGVPFPLLFGAQPFGRALDLVNAVRRDGRVIDWPLEESPCADTGPLYVSGRAAGEGMVLAAAAEPAAVGRLHDALRRVRPELAMLLSPLAEPMVSADVGALFDEMTRLNSQLTTTQRQLAKANAELEASNAQKDQLLGMLAHDLRTPLHVIGGFAQLLQQRLEGGVEARDLMAIERIRESSLFMRHLIEDVLSMSALKAGRLQLAPRPTDLGALVRRNVATNGILAHGRDVAIDCDVDDGLPPALIDPPRIEQVMNNLLSNAVKFSNPGTRIRVAVTAAPAGLRVSVADHGPGIAPEEMDRLFQPFSRTKAKVRSGDASVGLGLFICRSIVEAHGGRITAESTPDEGATFRFVVPAAEA